MHFLELVREDLCHPDSILLSREKRWTCTTCFADGEIRRTLECHPDSVILTKELRWQCGTCGRLREVDKTLRCHPESLVVRDVPRLTCGTCCGRNAFASGANVYQYVQQDFPDHFRSSQLAQAFHAWTGDENVPLTFPLDVTGLLPKRVKGQSIARVRETIHILRAVNEPFAIEGRCRECPEMDQFLTRFVQFLTRPTLGSSTEQEIVRQLIASMREIVRSKDFPNPFALYFEKLVPLVQYCARHEGWKPAPPVPAEANLALELYAQLVRSSEVRTTFSKYSILFDTVHVLLGCYACSSDSDAVANWVLDMIARVCRGDFFWKRYEAHPSVGAMQRFLRSNVGYNKNTHLYHVVRAFRNGESSECLSANWTTFLQLQAFVANQFKLPDASPDLRELVFGQLFPAVLFQDHCDQVGFALQMGHLMSCTCLKTGQVTQKGSFKTAKRIHDVIRKIMKRIQEFDGIRNIWTIDTLHQFLASDGNDMLVEEMRELSHHLLVQPEN